MTNNIVLNKTISTEGIDETVSINVPMYEGFRAEDLYILGQILHSDSTKLDVKLPKLTDLQAREEIKRVKNEPVKQIESKVEGIKPTYESKLDGALQKAKIETTRDYAKDEKRVEQAFKDTYSKVEHLDANAKPNVTLNKLLFVECPHCSGTHIMMSDVDTQKETEIKCPKCKQPIKVSALSKMSKMKYECECGGKGFMHFATTTTTDLPLRQGDSIIVACVKCKKEIDLEYNEKNNTFEQYN